MSDHGYCQDIVIPIKKEPSGSSEMVSQLLFGETYETIETFEDWLLIRTEEDDYEGWIRRLHHSPLDNPEEQKSRSRKTGVSLDLVARLEILGEDIPLHVVRGSSLPGISDGTFNLGDKKYKFTGNWQYLTGKPDHAALVSTARNYLNTPYLWGGRSPFGIDCSGFVQVVCKIHGIPLLRDAAQQATQGETINFLSDSNPGDLAFFEDEEGHITHVGLIVDEQHIIHASGRVRIDTLDHHGIYSKASGSYTHRLRLIKRVL